MSVNDMKIRQLFDSKTCTFSYLVWDEPTREAVLIDPVLDQVERDIHLINELSLQLRATLETHIHADHITGGGKIRAAFNSQYIVHKNSAIECADRLVDDGDSITLGLPFTHKILLDD